MKLPGSFWVPLSGRRTLTSSWNQTFGPKDSRIDLMVAQFLSKVIQVRRDTYTRKKVLSRPEQLYEFFANNSWLIHTARMLLHYQLKGQLLVKGMNSFHPECIEPPPWAQTLIF